MLIDRHVRNLLMEAAKQDLHLTNSTQKSCVKKHAKVSRKNKIRKKRLQYNYVLFSPKETYVVHVTYFQLPFASQSLSLSHHIIVYIQTK